MKTTLSEYRWKYLPYGFWTEQDGAVVIFNRRYVPLWRHKPGVGTKKWEKIDNSKGTVWIKYVNQFVFYNDGDVIGKERQLVNMLIKISTRMRIPVPTVIIKRQRVEIIAEH